MLDQAPALNASVVAVKEAVVSKQTQLAAATHEWEELNAEVPKMVEALEAQVSNLPKAKREATKVELEAMKAAWAEATAAFSAGDPTQAADKGRQVQAKGKELFAAVGDEPGLISGSACNPAGRLLQALLLAVGISWMGLRPPEPVFRGSEQSLGVEFEVAHGVLNAFWPDTPGAKGYELQLYAADGSLVHSWKSPLPGQCEFAQPGAGRTRGTPAFVEVAALNESGQTLMRSQRMVLSIPER